MSDNEAKEHHSNTASTLRASLQPTYPEIDELYSDAYLTAVLSAPNRSYEYARDEKIRGALESRKSYKVDALMAAFDYDVRGVLRRNNHREDGDNSTILFTPSQSLVDVCVSGAFSFAGFDNKGRGLLHTRAGLLDWWKTGVEDGIRYHILVLEYALRMLADRNENLDDGAEQKISESLVLCVDTTELGFIPPPLGTFTEMASLMQRAYPDRIHRIYIGPVNSVLRKLYELVLPYLRPRSRDKIVLLDCAPTIEEVAQIS
eukprot:CAMPEP_0172298496 /NCGR_PEP_ID=MMETSP1058-20130122/1127_1 /TAXON_ID=83371 /ORGANISM="Detonula confervacea, Strain CCMP 353" /LENGTH=259 /DNA_ID=CAMNT_0013007771 /DNA_START=162 /DNA_END=941 /DNA_ORIENTATION=-